MRLELATLLDINFAPRVISEPTLLGGSGCSVNGSVFS